MNEESRHPCRRAMTLIEILVVMSVMLILVSAVVVAVFRISGKGPQQGTKGLLEKLSIGLEAYRATYRMYPEYPPANTVMSTSDPAEVLASSAVLWQSLEFDGNFLSVGSQYKVEITAFDIRFSPGFVGAFIEPKTQPPHWSSYYYQDAWQQPILYLCSAPYNQYTLTSGGPDLILGTADDIVKP